MTFNNYSKKIMAVTSMYAILIFFVSLATGGLNLIEAAGNSFVSPANSYSLNINPANYGWKYQMLSKKATRESGADMFLYGSSGKLIISWQKKVTPINSVFNTVRNRFWKLMQEAASEGGTNAGLGDTIEPTKILIDDSIGLQGSFTAYVSDGLSMNIIKAHVMTVNVDDTLFTFECFYKSGHMDVSKDSVSTDYVDENKKAESFIKDLINGFTKNTNGIR